MKRLPIYVLYGAAIMILVSAYDTSFNRHEWIEYYNKHIGEKADLLDSEALVAKQFYRATRSTGQLSEFLENRRRSMNINFFVVYRGNEIVDSALDPEELARLTFDRRSEPGSINGGDPARSYYYVVENLDDDLQVVVGIRNNVKEFLRAEFAAQRKLLFHYLLGLLIVCLGTFVFFFRDIISSIQNLGQMRRRTVKIFRPLSKEADLLQRGIAAYDDDRIAMVADSTLLRGQVLPSLRKELASGQLPPYDFACTLVRTDINQFSKIFVENPVEDFIATIDEFFTDATHAIGRHGGYVHEFVGDEVIYYFKDSEVGNSAAAALAAIRDLHAIAESIHQRIFPERGYPFKVKSAFAEGRLRFGRLVNGFSLAGPPLIETVRILSLVTEKDGHAVAFDDRHLKFLANTSGKKMRVSIVKTEPIGEVSLKGFAGSRRLMRYTGHSALEPLLSWENSGLFDDLKSYRNDEDLKKIIDWAYRSWRSAAPENVVRLIGLLREIVITKSDGQAAKALLEWLRDLMPTAGPGVRPSSEGQIRILASALRLAERLAPWSLTPSDYEEILTRATRSEDRRVIANALESLMMIRAEEANWVTGLTQHPDNRVAANALIFEGRRAIEGRVVKRLNKMLNAKKEVHVASALYALGEIAMYHRSRDRIYYQTQIDFLRMVERLTDFAFHHDDMIRRQALAAVRKIGDGDLRHAILQATHDPHFARHRDEVQKILAAPIAKRAA